VWFEETARKAGERIRRLTLVLHNTEVPHLNTCLIVCRRSPALYFLKVKRNVGQAENRPAKNASTAAEANDMGKNVKT